MGAEPKRINWPAARAYYLALEPERRTLAAVAQRFQVSDSRVSVVARRDGWLDEASKIDDRVDRRAVTMIVRNRAERLARTMELYDRVVDLSLEQLPLDENGRIDVAKIDAAKIPRIDQLVEKIPGLFRAAELAAGEATDRVALSELQPVLVAFARIAVIHAPADARGEVLRELEQASAGMVSLGSAAA